MAKNTVIISVLADAKDFTRGLSDAGKGATGLGNAVRGLGVAAAAGLAAASAAAVALVASSVKAAGESEKVAAQTAAVVKSTGEAAGKSADQISQLATKLSRISGVDDEVVQSAENILLTFTQIKGDQFDEATLAALDLARAMGTDASSAALTLGKALNDPLAGITKLTKQGVTFSDQQKKQIANYVKLGDTAKAQQIILDEVNREFGGSAEAFGNTWEGALGKIKTSFGNIQEQIGGVFLPALAGAGSAVAGVFDAVADNPKFSAWLNGLGTKLSAGLKPLTDLLTLAASSGDPFGTFVDGLAKISPVFAVLKGVFDGLKPQLPLIQDGFQKLGDALGVGLAKYGPQLADAFGQIVQAIVPLLPQVLALIPAILPLVPPLLQLATQIIPPLASLLGTVLPPAISGLSGLLGVLGPALSFVVSGFTGSAQALGLFFDLLSGNKSLLDFEAAILAIPGPFGDVQRALSSFGTTLGTTLGEALSNVRGFVSKVVTTGSQIIDFFATLPARIVGTLSGLAGMFSDIGRNMIQGLINGASSLLGNLGSFVANLAARYIVNPIKNALGIHSPSRVFAEIGGYTMEGLQIGLSDTSGVRGAIDSLGKELASTTLPAPQVSSITTRPSALAAEDSATSTAQVVSQMTAADRAFFTELFREFAGSLTITDGVIAAAASSGQARLVKAGAL